MASDAKAAFKTKDYFVIDIPAQNDTDPDINGSLPKIDNLEYFPKHVLVHIFSNVDDIDLLHLSDCSYRFEGIAKIQFKRKYANKYFVFNGRDCKNSKRKMYTDLFERLGRYANLKAIEVKYMQIVDENHWVLKLLRQYTNELDRLTFSYCSFKRMDNILSQHINVTHLALRSNLWKNPLQLPKYRNLKKFELSDTPSIQLIQGEIIEEVLENNPSMESLILIIFGRVISIHSIAKHLKYLKELHLKYSVRDDWYISQETMDFIANSLKHVEILKLAINSEHIELVKRLSSKCKNLKQLELDYDYFEDTAADCSDEIIQAASRFHTVESLELSHLRSYDSIKTLVEYLPKLHRLHDLKLFMDSPQQSNTFIPSLSSNSPSLKTITITSWNELNREWVLFYLSTAIFKDLIQTVREPFRYRSELKIFRKKAGFATNKVITWCNERSQWIVNDSILFSIPFVCFFYFMTILIFFFPFHLRILSIVE